MRVLVFLLAVLVSIPLATASMSVTEIMYDFPGSDSGHEWIEIYNNGTEGVNLTDWKFVEDGTNHGLTLKNGSIILNASGYAIIADNSDTFLSDNPSFNGTLFDSTFSLGNTGEYLALRDSSGTIVENISYNSSWGANGDGNSLQKLGDSWTAATPTLGLQTTPPTTTTTSTTTTTTSTTTSTSTTTTSTTTTSTTVPTTTTTIPTCDLAILVNTTGIVYDVNTAIEYKVIVNDTACNDISKTATIEHWIEDLYGKTAKENKTSDYEFVCKQTKDFQWTPKDIIGSDAFAVKAKIKQTSCSDSNQNNDYGEKIIVVKGPETTTTSSTTSTTSTTTTTTTKATTTTQNQTTTTQAKSAITGKAAGILDRISQFFSSLINWFRDLIRL